MADITKEIISFDIDATQASRQIDALIANLEQLQQQEKELAKAGKDVSAVQTQIAATTQKLNKALGENVKTQKGLQAQADVANKSLRALNNTQNNLEASTEKATKGQAKLASSLARNAGKVTNIGGALGLAAGGLATFTGAAELGGIALGLLTNITNKAFTALDNYLFPVNEATRLSQELAGSYIAEAADLSALSGIIQDTTTKTDDRARAIDALNAKYKDYLPALLTEKSTNEEVAAAIQKGGGHKIRITHEDSGATLNLPVNSVVVGAAARTGQAISTGAEKAIKGLKGFAGQFRIDIVSPAQKRAPGAGK